jgi:EamA domain-containing membrane protein RarD
MGTHAPHHHPVTVDLGLLLLPLAGALLGLFLGGAVGEAELGAILGAISGILAGTTLRMVRSLPDASRGLALALVSVLVFCGGATLAVLVLR